MRSPSEPVGLRPDQLSDFKARLEAERAALPVRLDEASEDGETVDTTAIAARLEASLTAVESALASIDDGTYGSCADCGRSIPLNRLAAVPQTARCLSCQSRSERAGTV
jgi:DnaK suppressor protein